MLLNNNLCGAESVLLGLANGVPGRAIGLVFDPREPPQPPDSQKITLHYVPLGMFVYVPTARVEPLPNLVPEVLAAANNDASKIIFVEPTASTLPKLSAQRIQFPLSPAYALTIHKSQGLNISNLIADPITRLPAKEHHNLVYVMLSRVRTSAGLVFLGHLPPGWLQHAPDPDLLAEEERLRNLDITLL